MLIIPCPHCGHRDEGEFTYGSPVRHVSLTTDTAASHQALYHWINLREIWFHTSGCESWITVTRNTATHEFVTEQDA